MRFTSYTFDCNTGLPKTATDDNNIVTTLTYDNTGRATNETQAGGGISRSTQTPYDDLNLAVKTRQQQSASSWLSSETDFDALGRVRLVTDAAGNRVASAYRYGAGVTYDLT